MTTPAAPRRDPSQTDNVISPTRFRPPAGGVELPVLALPWKYFVVLGLLVLSLWATWFILTARSVGITVDPAGATVKVETFPAPRVGDHWLLRPGRRQVRVSAPGYTTFSGAIVIGAQPLQTHAIKLERLPGQLRVNLTPVASAEVYVDGERRGTAPGVVVDIRAGMRDIEVRAERYLNYTAALDIEGKGIEQTLAVKLEPAWAILSVDSRPHGADIEIDGQALGSTPRELEVLQGRRVVELTRPGYKPWRQTLKVVAGQAIKLGEVVLAKADGQLALSSTPLGANVTVDGEFRGRTPLEIALTPDKTHLLRLLKEGYAGVEQSLSVPSGERQSLAIELVPELATIQLTTLPADAELLVDGQAAGNASQTLSLPTHEHEIVVRRAGYATFQTTITPRKGLEKRYRIRLKTLAEAGETGASAGAGAGRRQTRSSGSSAANLTTFAGQELKLFRGGRVVMGSPRRDSARRANEIEREALLERAFYLSVKEVSNGEFRRFLANHVTPPFSGNQLDDDSLPVANLTWQTAALYCNWLSRKDGLPPFYQIRFAEVLGINPDSTGYRLPTEAEWEWAARVPPQGAATIYPWGDRFPPHGRSGNYADSTAGAILRGTLGQYNDGFAAAAPLGSFSPNLHGLYDLGGNVAEWVHDYYDAAPAAGSWRDPLGPPTGIEHVIKGASWAQGSATELRLAFRDFGALARNDVGFRLARYAQ